MSGATQTIDILVTVDADYLIAHPHDVQGSIAMLVNHDSVGNDDGGAELKVNVKEGDIIRWRATSLSRNFDRIALITSVVGQSVQDSTGTIDPPRPLNFSPIPVPYLEKDKKTIAKTDVTYTLWQSTALTAGDVWYTLEFVLLDRHLKQTGPFNWDPFIHISDDIKRKRFG